MAVKREGYPEDVPVHEGAPSKGLNLMSQPAHTLTIMYPVMLVNLLPCDLSYQVKNTPAKGNIKAGKSVPLYTVSTMFCPFTFGEQGMAQWWGALASHQCGPGSNPHVDAICGLSLLLVLSFAPRGFSPGIPVFTPPQIKTFPNSNSTRNQVDEEPLYRCATSKSFFILHLRYIKDWKLTEIYFKY